MPTALGAPAPPAAAPPAPPTHSRVAPTPAHTPCVRGSPFGHVLGGPIFRLPLRFIGAAAVGPSSEEAGASSGWLGALLFGGDTQSLGTAERAASGGWPGAALARSLALGLRAAAPRLERTPVPTRGGGRPAAGGQAGRQAGTALRVSAPHSHVSPAAPWPPAEVRVARRGQEPPGPGQGKGAPALPPCPRLPGSPQFSLFSLFSSPLACPRAKPRSA